MASRNFEKDNYNIIISSAEKIILENGPEKSSLSEIAKLANVSKGTLYYYFKTKDELLIALAERHMGDMTKEYTNISSMISNTPIEILLAELIEAVLNDDFRSQIHQHLLHAAFSGKAEIRKKLLESYSTWVHQIIDGLKEYGFNALHREPSAKIIVAIIDGLVLQKALLGDEWIPSTKWIAQFICSYLNE